MPLYKVEAINIKTNNFGEADKLVTLYSKERGKIRAIAKGARRVNSRFGGRLELFVHHQALLGEGKDLDHLNQSETINTHVKLRENLESLSTASYFAWVLDKATEEKQINKDLFILLQNCLDMLVSGGEINAVRHGFQKKFLIIEGIMPHAGETLTDKAFLGHFGNYTSVHKLMGENNDQIAKE